MKHFATLLSIGAALPAAEGIAFAGPAPTDTSPERGLVGSNPEPTTAPSVNELRKRQKNLYPNTCGWVDGDFASGVTCSAGRTCMLYTSASIGMAGCCSGSDTEVCGWTDSCVDYSAYAAGNCGTNCMFNDFVRKCTNLAAPYCVTWTYPGDGVADYGCAATSTNTIYTVLQSATDSVGDTTSMALPTVTGNAVTGYNDMTGTGGSSSPTNDTYSTGTSTRKKVAVGLIIGIVIAALAILFFIGMGVFCLLKRKKKQRQLAANAQAVAAAQANRPQSMFPQSQQQQPPMQMQPQQGGFIPQPNAQQGGFVPPMSPQSPQPTINGYFPPPGQQEQKYNGHTSVTEYAVTPISSPSSPVPAYAQPYGTPNALPMSSQPTAHAHYHNPNDGSPGVSPPAQFQRPVVGAHEVDAVSVPHVPQGSGPVYEMGQGR